MHRPPRFFITPGQVEGTHITVAAEDLRHIRTVLRKKPGDLLILCDGLGSEYTVRITDSNRAQIITEIIEKRVKEIGIPRITLGQGLARSDAMDWIAQKATELGVSNIVPLVTERTIVKIKDEEARRTRWQKICREAAMQCGRPDIPQVGTVTSLRDFVTTLAPPRAGQADPMTLLLLPWEEGTKPVKEVLRNRDGLKQVVVLIGPEGGLSTAEAETAQAGGFVPASLGSGILRTETAALAVLSMILYEYA